MNIGLILLIIRLRFEVFDLPNRIDMPLYLTYFQVILSCLGFYDLRRLASGFVWVNASALAHLIRGAESLIIVVCELSLGSTSLEV